MRRRTVNYVFFTGTFSRDKDVHQAWQEVNGVFNRYVQRYRRATHGNSIHYVRTVEAHQDDYPHVHAVFYFSNAIIVENDRYFDKQLYALWKGLWTVGLSDYQPTSGKISHSVYYIVKYIAKQASLKTIWRKLFVTPNTTTSVANAEPHTLTTASPSTVVQTIPTLSTKEGTTLFLCQQYKIKQVTWSRGFKWPRLDKPLLVSAPQQVLNKT